jgi:hypothetical protein
MARITKEEYRASATSGLNLHDVVAVWLVFARWSRQLHLPFPAIFMRGLPPHRSQLL